MSTRKREVVEYRNWLGVFHKFCWWQPGSLAFQRLGVVDQYYPDYQLVWLIALSGALRVSVRLCWAGWLENPVMCWLFFFFFFSSSREICHCGTRLLCEYYSGSKNVLVECQSSDVLLANEATGSLFQSCKLRSKTRMNSRRMAPLFYLIISLGIPSTDPWFCSDWNFFFPLVLRSVLVSLWFSPCFIVLKKPSNFEVVLSMN